MASEPSYGAIADRALARLKERHPYGLENHTVAVRRAAYESLVEAGLPPAKASEIAAYRIRMIRKRDKHGAIAS
jgi:hypothetical protein